MMLSAKNTQYEVKRTNATNVTVPDNPICKFKYYLHCIFAVIDMNKIDKTGALRRLTNYQELTEDGDELGLILKLSTMLSPDVLIDKCLFIAPDLCKTGRNEFYEISQINKSLAIELSSGIIINGVQTNVKSIMACTKDWLTDNYYKPLLIIAQAIQQEEERKKRARVLNFMLASMFE